jgi:NTE family protein
MKSKTIGLALGGGGAKGLAHIGVLKTFLRAGFKIDYLAGTSMGSLVGGLYAATEDIDFIERTFLDIAENYSFHRKHLRGKKNLLFTDEETVEKMLSQKIDGLDVKNTRIPFKAIATDVKDGDEVVIDKGSLVKAIRASSALPIAFPPVEIDGRLLMDGGFVNPVPVDIVKKMGAECVIGVDVSSKWPDIEDEHFSLSGIKSTIVDAFSALEYQVAKEKVKDADFMLHPPVLSFHWDDFRNAKDIIQMGVNEATNSIREIRERTHYPKPVKKPLQSFIDFISGNDL